MPGSPAQENIPVVHNQWFKGQSDTPMLGSKGQFFKAKNIDNITEPNAIKMACLPQLIGDFTGVSSWDGSITMYSKYAKVFTFSSLGRCYDGGTLVQTIGNCDVLYGVIEFVDKIIFAYLRTGDASQIYYGFIPIDSSGNMGVPYNPDVWFVSNFGQFSVVLHNYNDALLLLGVGNRIFKLEPTFITNPHGGTPPTPPDTPVLQFKKQDTIVSIVQSLEQFRVYTTYGNKDAPVRSTCYICQEADIETGQISNVINYYSMCILAAKNDVSYDRALCSDGVYMLSGTQKTLVTRRIPTVEFTKRSNFDFWGNFFAYEYDENNINQHVCLIGRYFNGYPTQVITHLDFQDIKSMYVGFAGLYVSGTYVIGGVAKKGVFLCRFDPVLQPSLTPFVKCETAEIETLTFYGNVSGTIKKLEEYLLGYELPAGSTIELQIKVNKGSAVSIKTFSGAEYEGVQGRWTAPNQWSESLVTNFCMMSLIVKFTRGTDTTLSPAVYDILQFYSDLIKGS